MATQKIGPPSSVSAPQTAKKYSSSFGTLIRPVRVQPVIAHADAEADAHPVEERRQGRRRPREVEQRGDGADVEADHGDEGDPVDHLVAIV